VLSLSTALWSLGGLAAIGATAAYALFWAGKPKAIPDRVESFACFQLTTRTHHFRSGWNQGRLGWGQYERYSVGVAGQEAREYNAVFVLPEAMAIVVNSGDPNNTSHYDVLRCPATTLSLGDSLSGMVSASWLDAENGKTPEDIGAFRRMRGGSLLLLGGRIILDTKSFQHFPAPNPPGWEFHPNFVVPPLGASPDRQSYARFAMRDSAPTMAVYNFITGETYDFVLDRRRFRYTVPEELDRAWFQHHFVWRSAPGQPDRLMARPDFVPLAYRGYRSFHYPNHREYRLLDVAPEMRPVLRSFVMRKFAAEAVAGDETILEWNKRQIHVTARHEGDDRYVSVWIADGQDDSVLIQIADGFDQVLATGEYDRLFHADIE
jgi:hypothetical protein